MTKTTMIRSHAETIRAYAEDEKKHIEKVLAASGFKISDEELYYAYRAAPDWSLAGMDSEMRARLIDVRKRFAARASVAAALARAAASRSRQPSPPPSPKDTLVTPLPGSVAPQPSRAAHVAEVHLAGINASRKRAGLPLLTATELTREFADLELQPALATTRKAKMADRRAAGNAIAARQGLASPAAIDTMWTSFAATSPGRGLENGNGPSLSRSRAIGNSDAPRSQAEVDSMHSEIVAKLNATLPAQWRPDAGRRS